jgi:hypothetical protein
MSMQNSRRTKIATIPAFLIAPLWAGAQMQPVPSVRLGPSTGDLQTEFSEITSMVELADGRVLISDRLERRVVVADFSAGTVSPVGRTGPGPGEYMYATKLIPLWGQKRLGGSTALMIDVPPRWLVFEEDSIVETVAFSQPAYAATNGLIVGADSNGYVLALGERSFDRPLDDSIPLLKVSLTTGRADTVAKIGPRARQAQMTFLPGETRPETIRMFVPILAAEEEALSFPDGWIAVARVHPYRVDWFDPQGRRIVGAPLPFQETPLNEREKQAYRERRAATGLSAPSASAEWASSVPPFMTAVPHSPLLAAPDGRIVIARTPTANQPENRYDLVDRRGRLTAQLVLPANTQLVAIGSQAAYLVSNDSFGLQHVHRHAWPPR